MLDFNQLQVNILTPFLKITTDKRKDCHVTISNTNTDQCVTDLPVDMQPKSTNLSTRPAKQSNTSSVEVSVLLHVHS